MPPTPLALWGGKILSGISGSSIMHLLLQVFCQMNNHGRLHLLDPVASWQALVRDRCRGRKHNILRPISVGAIS